VSRNTTIFSGPSAVSAPQLGLFVLLASLTMIFGATLVAYAVTRAQSSAWVPDGAGGLPIGLVASSALLVGVSAGFEWSLASVRANRLEGLMTALGVTLAFALAFLFGQLLNWHAFATALPTDAAPTLYSFCFYMLTGTHAAHVLGGLVPLGIVMYRAKSRAYSSSRYEGLKLCAQYWHYLGAVWLVILAALALGS
jgi:heme/copper-type cytochrome/quinol oxidase subunit 3